MNLTSLVIQISILIGIWNWFFKNPNRLSHPLNLVKCRKHLNHFDIQTTEKTIKPQKHDTQASKKLLKTMYKLFNPQQFSMSLLHEIQNFFLCFSNFKFLVKYICPFCIYFNFCGTEKNVLWKIWICESNGKISG